MVREIPCYAGQFGSYFLTKKLIAKLKGVDEKQLGPADQFVAGGIGGFFCWFFSYPPDVVKTRLQSAKTVEFQKYKMGSFRLPDGGMIECSKQIYRLDGWLGFWRGFSACTVRAFLSNAFMFMSYEFA